MSQDLAKDIKIAYLGTPDISAIPLEGLISAGYTISALFCRPDKEKGRGKKLTSCPTKTVAEKHNIPIFQPKNKTELTDQVSKLNPDLIIVFAYGMIIPKEAYDAPKYKTINIHPSLLPKYRGPSPVIFPLLNGDKETGVSIIRITEKMDAGPILSVEKEIIKEDDTARSLGERLAEKGSRMIVEFIPKWINGDVKPQEQDDLKASSTKMIVKADGHIDWSKSALGIERQIRAFTPWPGSFTYWSKDKDKKIGLKITQAKTGDQKNKYKVGEVFLDEDNKFSIQTKDGVLTVKKLQIEGKKELSSEEFLRGYPDIIGSVLS